MSDSDSESGPQEEPLDSRTRRLLHGDLRWAVLLLAAPVIAEQLLNSMVGLADTWLSGRVKVDGQLSPAPTSAVGMGVYVNWLAELLFSLIGTGATALVARHWGASEKDKASRAASCALALSLVMGVLGILAVYLAAEKFTEVLGIEETTRALSTRYLRLVCFGHIFTSILLIGGAALRGAGNTWTPMKILGLVSGLNIVFSGALVMGDEYPMLWSFGVEGLACGTIAARFVGACIMVFVLCRGSWGLKATLNLAAWKDTETARRILRIGAPAAADGLLLWGGHFLFLKIIAGLDPEGSGSAIFAAHIVGIQIEAFNYLPASAFGIAAATLVGQCLGASQPERATRGGHEAAFQASLVACAAGLCFYFGAAAIYAFMHEDPAVSAAGVPAMRLLALFELPLTITIVYSIAIRGAGDTMPPLIANVLGVYGVRLTGGYWLAVEQGYGLAGAWAGRGVDGILRGTGWRIYFHRGRWKKRKV
ncbi:MAG: MATE family efflux transporter [Planctomycetes bacterium]|nr:MATE family efflux transporter [Planctomycetota bacterium]